MIRGSKRKADIITDGDGDVIAAGSGGGLVDTGIGKDDVVFLPAAAGETDSGTTVVVSPGVTTLVGGGANDKLVLLADRLGDGSDAGTPSDTSDTIQLLGGWNPYGDGQDGIPSYYKAGDPSGTADCYAKYLLKDGDLYVSVVDYETSAEANGLVDGVIWDGEVVIKNFQQGDYGLTFTTSDDYALLGSGAESAADFEVHERQAMESLTAAPRAADQVDDDPDASWRGQAPLATVCSEPVLQFAPVSDAAIAADLGAVMADGGPAPPSPEPQGDGAPAAPSIADATPAQATAAEAPASPFGGVTITDGNAGATDTVTIMRLGGGGTLSGAGLTADPDGTYTLAAADPATVTAELRALTFTPTAPAAGAGSTALFTLVDRSSAGTRATDVTASVTDTAAGTPATSIAIAGTQAGQATDDLPMTPFSGVTVADDNSGAADALTIALSGAGGTLAGAGLTADPDGTYTVAGIGPSEITAELRALTFTPAPRGAGGPPDTTAFTLVDRNSAGASASDAITTVTDAAAVAISGAQGGQSTAMEAPVQPFSGVTVADGNAGATDTLTIALSGGGGTLAGDGLTANADGTYTLAAADPATVTAELDALSFTPDALPPGGQSTTTFTLTDQSSAGVGASDDTTTVTDAVPLLPVTVTGVPATQDTVGEAPVAPFAGATIADGNAGATESVLIGVFGAGGTLSGAGLTATPYGFYSLDPADPDTVTAELRGLVFTPAASADGTPSSTTLLFMDQSSAGPGPVYGATTVTDTPAGAFLQAGPGTVTLQAPDGTASLTSGTGDDTFYGGDGDDTFVYAAQSGDLTVSDVFQTGWGSNTNTLSLAAWGPGDLSFSRTGSDLVIAISGSGRTVDVVNEFDPGLKDGVDRLRFADGSLWSRDDMARAAAGP